MKDTLKIKLLLTVVIALFCATANYAYAQDEDSAESDSTNENLLMVRHDPPGMPTMPVPFGIGEKIEMHVSFGFVPAGKAKLEVVDTVTVRGQLCYHVRSTARSAKGYDWIYKVRDSIDTWIDADSIYAHRFYKKLREGGYRDEKLVEFLIADSLAPWWDDGEFRDSLHVEPFVQDVFSAGFKTRTLPLVVGDTLYIRTHDVKKTYDLLVIVHGREEVETLAGKFDCFKTEPVMKSGGLFKKERKARLFVWVTADERRIPVMMTSRTSFGTFTVQLESYTPPSYTLPLPTPAPQTEPSNETDLRDSINVDL